MILNLNLNKLRKPSSTFILLVILYNLVEISFIFLSGLLNTDTGIRVYFIPILICCNFILIAGFLFSRVNFIEYLRILIRVFQWFLIGCMLYFALRSPWIMIDKVMWFGSRNMKAALHPVLSLAFHGEFFLFIL